jgi:hypothetical protein
MRETNIYFLNASTAIAFIEDIGAVTTWDEREAIRTSTKVKLLQHE